MHRDFVVQAKCTIFWFNRGLRVHFDLYVPYFITSWYQKQSPLSVSRFVTPSPGAYNPQTADKETRRTEPQYSFGIKPESKKGQQCPGKASKGGQKLPSQGDTQY